MKTDVARSIKLLAVTVAICGVAYPAAVLWAAMAVAPERRLGSLAIAPDGRVVGSRLIGQGFTRPEYLWPRPSACGFDAAAAAGSNLSPANPALRRRAEAILTRLDRPAGEAVPADLATASGSGLDPHVSLDGALVQAPRIAKARNLDEHSVRRLIDDHARRIPLTRNDAARIVNVLEFNLALDRISSGP